MLQLSIISFDTIGWMTGRSSAQQKIAAAILTGSLLRTWSNL